MKERSIFSQESCSKPCTGTSGTSIFERLHSTKGAGLGWMNVQMNYSGVSIRTNDERKLTGTGAQFQRGGADLRGRRDPVRHLARLPVDRGPGLRLERTLLGGLEVPLRRRLRRFQGRRPYGRGNRAIWDPKVALGVVEWRGAPWDGAY